MVDVTMEEFLLILGRGVVHHAAHVEHVLRAAAEHIEATAKAMIGHERAEWPPLAQYTMDQRVALGFSENDPLLRTGHLRDAITHDVELREVGGVAVVGVKDATVGTDAKNGPDPVRNIGDVAVWMELGTGRAPSRSFLAQAVIDEMPVLEQMFGKHLAGGLFEAPGQTLPIPGLKSLP